MVEKVDIISAPSKFSVQPAQKEVQSATEAKENENRKVDWKTIGIAGTALAAIVGAVILIRRGNAGKAAETVTNAGSQTGRAAETATNVGSHTTSAAETTPPVDPEKALKELFEKYKDKFMLADKLSFESFKEIVNSPEFKTLTQMRVSVVRENLLPCKIVTDRLAETFGDGYTRELFKRTLASTKEDIIRDIAERNYFLSCNKAIVDATDALGNPIKYRDGYSIIPHYAQINPMTNKLEIIPASDLKIYSDRYGRYVRAEKGFSKGTEWEYINPKEISEETPRLTTVINDGEFYRMAERGDNNVLMIQLNELNKDKMLAFEYNPETKQVYEAYLRGETAEDKIPVSDKDTLSELAEIFDFTKLGEKDYMATIKEIVSKVIK